MYSFPEIKENQIENDFWERHMCYQPFDEETEERIKRHKALIRNGSDNFLLYVKHSENFRQ